MEHDFYLMIFGIKKIDHFDPYNVFLAIAINIPQWLKTVFVVQGHKWFRNILKPTEIQRVFIHFILYITDPLTELFQSRGAHWKKPLDAIQTKLCASLVILKTQFTPLRA